MSEKTKKAIKIIFMVLVIGAVFAGLLFGKRLSAYQRTWTSGRNTAVFAYIRNPDQHRQWELEALSRCGDAPFVLPTRGFIGYLYNDSFSFLKLHTGLDIFGGEEGGVTPVYAPFDGFITRELDWKSSLILRIPQDPLDPDRQIWVYMTHMADRYGNSLIETTYPNGGRDIPVSQGDLLGYQGNYSGNPNRPTGVHLHISIVRDDGSGNYLNELYIENTLDPSPYFGMPMDASTSMDVYPSCGLSR